MIDKLAFVHPTAKIGHNVTIGPWTYIGENVEIGDNTWISSHVVIKGPTVIGKGNRIFQFASVGEECQDKKYAGEQPRLIIGDNNIIRESVTIHRGTTQDNSETRIGSNCLFMAYVPIAHDCVVGNNVIMANNASIAGHVHVGDWAILGGAVNVQQFTKIGKHTFISGGGGVNKDVPPYVRAARFPLSYIGVNSVGLRRRGFDSKTINLILEIYRILFIRGYNTSNALKLIETEIEDSPVKDEITQFIRNSVRGIMKGFDSNK